MEIVSIERKTFEAMVAKFDRFVSRMDIICHRHGEKKMSEWMDNQESSSRSLLIQEVSTAPNRQFEKGARWNYRK